MTRKAQIEIMGLMVIVLILVFVILIVLKFVLVPKTNTGELQRQSIQASNMLNAIIRANTEDGSTVAKKIVECYNSAKLDSDSCKFLSNCKDNLSPCDPKSSFSRNILKRTFPSKKFRLEFSATGSNPLPSYGIATSCNSDTETTITGSATVSVSPQITAKITICVQQ